MSRLLLQNYYAKVDQLIQYGGSKKETSIRTAFQTLLDDYCKLYKLALVPELDYRTPKGTLVFPDGTVKDELRLDHGYWESKDEADDLNLEIQKKFDKGYPRENILFEDSNNIILVRGQRTFDAIEIRNPDALHNLLHDFLSYERPEVRSFREAVEAFKADVPDVLQTLRAAVVAAENTNAAYQKARQGFLDLCRQAINPDITPDDVREMLLQHILTEEIFLNIFSESQFHRENNIASELARITDTFFRGETKKLYSSATQRYYGHIKAQAAAIANHHEKQLFLKVIYENFYKAYNPKAADRLGVVYTPGEVVRFMIESTDHLLHKHFGRLLQDKNVEILDPATGTGTFVTELIDYLPRTHLEHKYRHEIHANEVSILPYYIANLNIEATYQQKMGTYAPFDNLVFVDTLDNMAFGYAGQQKGLFGGLSAENLERIKRQNERKISVIIGNPPYNANQMNENDNNKNREYPEIDKRIKQTYIAESTAQKTKVYDMYARFFRWASDRLGDEGIIAFITNRSFIDSRTFDGFRATWQTEFDYIYIVDTRSDVRANPKISGTKNNIFGIQTGVAIAFLVRIKPKK